MNTKSLHITYIQYILFVNPSQFFVILISTLLTELICIVTNNKQYYPISVPYVVISLHKNTDD
jgi:hypothetical protein